MIDKDFDNLINSKIAQKTFEYNDAYWQQASTLLKKNRFYLLKQTIFKSAFYLSSLVVFLLMTWFLVNKKQYEGLKTEKVALADQSKSVQNNLNRTEFDNLNLAENKVLLEANTTKNELNNALKISNSNVTNLKFNKQFKDNYQKDEIFEGEVTIYEESEPSSIESKNIDIKNITIEEPTFMLNEIGQMKNQITATKSKVLKSLNLSLDAGLNSFNNVLVSNSTGYFGGTSLYLNVGKLSLKGSLCFENINQNLPERVYVNKIYGYGSVTQSVKIKNQSIDYLIFGLSAIYPIYKNHALGVGVQYANLIQSNDLVKTENFERNINQTNQSNGYSSVLNNNDWQLCFTYQNRFAKHFAISATYVKGLNDVSNDLLFNNSRLDKNEGIKLGLHYILK
jgi:hypothetical protein